ncbi:SMI1/KNR4 family protein [Cerasicoccus frondis]|uniref:SMI1/KNR4 family protein n=1 Tax=Cerasicoccus frondis TaxID=490090 RepID=UPI002852B1FE|nr:SMI1/KNR4 family protein [Cerasicoccus frondis]
MHYEDAYKSLSALGWRIRPRTNRNRFIDGEVADRYKEIPKPIENFLSGISECVSPSEQSWFLCEADFAETSDASFSWNEWENMSLEAADGDTDLTTEITRFWSEYFPFYFSVDGEYQFYAASLRKEDFGVIVHGAEPEFEEVTKVFEDFSDFLEHLISNRSK